MLVLLLRYGKKEELEVKNLMSLLKGIDSTLYERAVVRALLMYNVRVDWAGNNRSVYTKIYRS